MSYKVSYEVSSGLHFLFNFAFSLFKNSPFGQISINNLNIVVFTIIICLNFNKTSFICLKSFVDNFQVVVIESFTLFDFADDFFLDLKFCHPNWKDYGWHNAFFI